MATRSRGISVVPEMEFRPETETRPEPEMDNPAEALREVGLWATRPYISDIASQYVTADRPDTTIAAFTASYEVVTESNPNYSIASQTIHVPLDSKEIAVMLNLAKRRGQGRGRGQNRETEATCR